MDKLALAFIALALVCVVLAQDAAKRRHFHSISVFAALAGICFVLAILFLLIALIWEQVAL